MPEYPEQTPLTPQEILLKKIYYLFEIHNARKHLVEIDFDYFKKLYIEHADIKGRFYEKLLRIPEKYLGNALKLYNAEYSYMMEYELVSFSNELFFIIAEYETLPDNLIVQLMEKGIGMMEIQDGICIGDSSYFRFGFGKHLLCATDLPNSRKNS